ncbi:DUF1592 domain-containing protein [Hirschia litorea]|uniref:DUF1592 domain-containing protein n=1 Tax=Hirschia litorea TaxID=1199156 RepID=A0ABW2IPL0_9PROT
MRRPILLIWLITIGLVLGVQFTAILAPLNGAEGAGFGRFLGRFHPLILHFPVAFLVLAGLLELTRLNKKTAKFSEFVGPVLVLAALSACATVILGILLASNEGHAGDLVERHRGRGIGVAILACLAAAIYYTDIFVKNTKLKIGYRACLGISIALMGLAAHDGGSMVHGPTYLADHAPKFLRPILITHVGEETTQTAQVSHDGTGISPDLIDRFQGDVGSFFGSYCSRCHGDGKQEANVKLADFDPTFQAHDSQHHWNRVLGVLGSHRMPPVEAKQPNGPVRAKAINWIQDALKEHALARRADRANAPLRRLSKRELNHVYQDLFNVGSDFSGILPSDPKSEHGYDTDADLLMVAMSDLRFYQDIAREAVNSYVKIGDRTDNVEHFFVEMEDVYHYGRLEGDNLSYDRAPSPISASELKAIKQAREGKTPIYRDRVYGPLPYGVIPTGDVRGVGEGRGFARLHEQFMLLRTKQTHGEVTVKVKAAMIPGKNGDKSVPRLKLEAGWRKIQSLRVSVIGEKDVTAPLDAPQTVEFKFRLEDVIVPEKARHDPEGEDRWLLLVLSNYARHEKGALAGSIYGQVDPYLPSYATVALPYREQAEAAAEYQKVGLAKWKEGGVPYLKLDAVEASITPTEANPESRWVIEPPASDEVEVQVAKVREVLSQYLPYVFRRSVHPSELVHYENLFRKLNEGGDGFEVALKETMASALISPEFLYIGYPAARIEADAVDREEIRQNNYLASRLSFFLWSSMPDETLMQLAADLKLTDPAVLAAQVERMLDDPKSLRMSRTFADQWLQLEKVANTGVSPEIYPDYSSEFAQLIVEETRSTFVDVVKNGRDARSLFKSEYMMLNEELARHYGVEGVVGGDMRRVHVGDPPERAGILTNASILTMNSNGQDSHPIKRGVWLLERALNDPPPPPPPSVPDLDTNNPLLANMTLKEKIEHHRQLSACSGCHEQIDPWGVAFENFDATGRWRDTVTVKEGSPPREVDASSVLPDGTHIAHFEEIKAYLLDSKEDVLMGNIVQHLMTYSLGRELDILDKQEAEEVATTFRASGYKIPELIKAIVQTDAFTNRNQHALEKQKAEQTMGETSHE